MDWLIGIIVVIIGSFLVVKTQWIYDFTGPIEWAEAHLGAEGGTRLFIKLIGVLMILGAIMAGTGLLGNLVRSVFGGLLGQGRSLQ